MSRAAKLEGQRFGRLTVVCRATEGIGKRPEAYWLCKCDCGGEAVATSANLLRGNTKSCGCLARETARKTVEDRRKYNEYRIDGNTVYVNLNESDVMICDLDDWNRLKDIKWYKNSQGYVTCRKQDNGLTKFHLFVLGKKDGHWIDHINRNKLDNRKCNLRFVTPCENNWNKGLKKSNKTGISGVIKRHGKWAVYICSNYKSHYIGTYDTKDEAATARREAERKYQPLPERFDNDSINGAVK